MRIALLTCAIFAAACGGNDSRPAQDPSTTSSTTVTAAPTNVGTTANDTSTSHPGDATLAPAGSTNAAVMASPGTTPAPGPQPAQTSASGDANVVNNPGAHDQTKNADNTGINDRDRHDTLTPMSQGNSSSELKITASIRRGVMGDKALSFTAKNVKIITVGTRVTLRGPVKTDAEKSAIETRAKQTPGVTDVDDQIEVKQ